MTKCTFDPTADIYKDAPIGMFHCPECGVRDDGSCSEYYGDPDAFVKFAKAIYEEGYDDGCFQATGGN